MYSSSLCFKESHQECLRPPVPGFGESQNCDGPKLEETDSSECCSSQYFCPNLPPHGLETETEEKPVVYDCPEGWMKLNNFDEPSANKCYKIFEPADWQTARKTCREYSGFLTSAESLLIDTLNFNEPDAPSSKLTNVSYWSPYFINENRMIVADGNELEQSRFSYICKNPLNEFLSGWDCDGIEQWRSATTNSCISGQLRSPRLILEETYQTILEILEISNCDEKKPFICSQEYNNNSFQIYPDTQLCPESWSYNSYLKICIQYISLKEAKTNYLSAMSHCTDLGGRMFEPNSREKKFLLYEIMKTRVPKPLKIWVISPQQTLEFDNECYAHRNPYIAGTENLNLIERQSCLETLPYMCERDKLEITPTKNSSALSISIEMNVEMPQIKCTAHDSSLNPGNMVVFKSGKPANLYPSLQVNSRSQLYQPEVNKPYTSQTAGKYQCAAYSDIMDAIIYSEPIYLENPDITRMAVSVVLPTVEFNPLYKLIEFYGVEQLVRENRDDFGPLMQRVKDTLNRSYNGAIEYILQDGCQFRGRSCTNTKVNNLTIIDQNSVYMAESAASGTLVHTYVWFSGKASTGRAEQRRKRQTDINLEISINGALESQGDEWAVLREYLASYLGQETGDTENSRVLTTDRCPSKLVEIESLSANITLPSAGVGERYNYSRCGSNGKPLIQALCTSVTGGGLDWKLETEECRSSSPETNDLRTLSLMSVTSSNIQSIANETRVLTSQRSLGQDDLTYIAEIFKSIATSYPTQIPVNGSFDQKVEELLLDLFSIFDHYILSDRETIYQAQLLSESSSLLLDSVDNICKLVVTLSTSNITVFSQTLPGVSVRLSNSDDIVGVISSETEINNSTIKYVEAGSSNVLATGKEVGLFLNREIADSKKSFFIYANGNLFRGSGRADQKLKSAGRIVSASIYSQEKFSEDYRDAVTIHYPNSKATTESGSMICGFWDREIDDWSTKGCTTTEYSDMGIICTCNHLTDFSVLLDANRIETTELTNEREILSIISVVGLAISITALGFVIITAMIYKRMRKTNSQKVLICLSVCLFSLNITFLVGTARKDNEVACIVSAVLIHYFLLASFAWMLVEAVLQYLRFVKVLGTYIPRFILKAALGAFGAPAVIIVIVLAIDHKMYLSEHSDICWMKPEGLYYSVILPIALVLIVNLIMFVAVMYNLTCGRNKNVRSTMSEKQLSLLHLKAALAVLVLLGLPWIFGFLVLISEQTTSITFSYIFSILNSIQGLLIFIFHCVREPTVVEEFKKRFKCFHKQKTTSDRLSSSAIKQSKQPNPEQLNTDCVRSSNTSIEC